MVFSAVQCADEAALWSFSVRKCVCVEQPLGAAFAGSMDPAHKDVDMVINLFS